MRQEITTTVRRYQDTLRVWALDRLKVDAGRGRLPTMEEIRDAAILARLVVCGGYTTTTAKSLDISVRTVQMRLAAMKAPKYPGAGSAPPTPVICSDPLRHKTCDCG